MKRKINLTCTNEQLLDLAKRSSVTLYPSPIDLERLNAMDGHFVLVGEDEWLARQYCIRVSEGDLEMWNWPLQQLHSVLDLEESEIREERMPLPDAVRAWSRFIRCAAEGRGAIFRVPRGIYFR